MRSGRLPSVSAGSISTAPRLVPLHAAACADQTMLSMTANFPFHRSTRPFHHALYPALCPGRNRRRGCATYALEIVSRFCVVTFRLFWRFLFGGGCGFVRCKLRRVGVSAEARRRVLEDARKLHGRRCVIRNRNSRIRRASLLLNLLRCLRRSRSGVLPCPGFDFSTRFASGRRR